MLLRNDPATAFCACRVIRVNGRADSSRSVGPVLDQFSSVSSSVTCEGLMTGVSLSSSASLSSLRSSARLSISPSPLEFPPCRHQRSRYLPLGPSLPTQCRPSRCLQRPPPLPRFHSRLSLSVTWTATGPKRPRPPAPTTRAPLRAAIIPPLLLLLRTKPIPLHERRRANEYWPLSRRKHGLHSSSSERGRTPWLSPRA
jgi:hypothetical protein